MKEKIKRMDVIKHGDKYFHIEKVIRITGEALKKATPFIRKYTEAHKENIEIQKVYDKDDLALYDTIRAFYPPLQKASILFIGKKEVIGVFADDYDPMASPGKLKEGDIKNVIQPEDDILRPLLTLYEKAEKSRIELVSAVEDRKKRYDNMWWIFGKLYPEVKSKDRDYVLELSVPCLKLVGGPLNKKEEKSYLKKEKEYYDKEMTKSIGKTVSDAAKKGN